MSIFTILETLFLGPLKLLFESIFVLANTYVEHPGLSIIFLSLAMNILVLPLYRQADAMQERSRDTEAKLHDGVAHIKKVFSGDEKMMILQTYYRQNNYKPTDALHGSVSLLLEVPFFMAAYQFLSHLQILQGVSFGPIADLGKPDGLIVIGAITLNLLPILMTAINFISSALYLKGFPLKTKIQLYGMAVFFLIFLYDSPAGLVFYWTLNNLFSLVKTIFYKIKNPRRALSVITSLAGTALLVYALFVYKTDTLGQRMFLVVLAALLFLPALMPLVKKLFAKGKSASTDVSPSRKTFLSGACFLAVLTGLLIPSTFIAASPQEYIDLTYCQNPLTYLVSTASMAIGLFVIWLSVFYWLAGPNGKVWFERIVWIMSGVFFIDYMFFGTDLGVISSALQYEGGFSFSNSEQIINVLVLLAAIALMAFVAYKWRKVVMPVLLAASIALGSMSVINIFTINDSVSKVQSGELTASPQFSLSKNGKNVVVIMLDRAMGEYVPYMFAEKEELKEKFAGFTYYSNCISHGGYTNFASPAMLGGYEYTPVELNKRDTELLVAKHNEALKVMPVLFGENGYKVTVCDPVYANYEWIPDLSIFDDHKDIRAYITKGKFSDPEITQMTIENNHRNFFCFSIMKSLPVFIQPAMYTGGTYNQSMGLSNLLYSVQTRENLSVAHGLSEAFMSPYNVLLNMNNMTKVTDDEANTFLFLTNDTTHEPMMLQEPDYVPVQDVDNTEFDETNAGRFELDGNKLKVTNKSQMIHYQSNMAALLRLADWFDYLRENGVYDNTKIILVSDHGRDLGHNSDLIYSTGNGSKVDAELFYPLLMVKDFGSKEFTVSDEFMTNADVPYLATLGTVDDPVNPFTGNPITTEEKTKHDQFIILSDEWQVGVNNGTTFIPSKWASVSGNIRSKDSWKFLNKSCVLKDYSFDAE